MKAAECDSGVGVVVGGAGEEAAGAFFCLWAELVKTGTDAEGRGPAEGPASLRRRPGRTRGGSRLTEGWLPPTSRRNASQIRRTDADFRPTVLPGVIAGASSRNAVPPLQGALLRGMAVTRFTFWNRKPKSTRPG